MSPIAYSTGPFLYWSCVVYSIVLVDMLCQTQLLGKKSLLVK